MSEERKDLLIERRTLSEAALAGAGAYALLRPEIKAVGAKAKDKLTKKPSKIIRP